MSLRLDAIALILNQSGRPDDQVDAILGYVAGKFDLEEGQLAIKLHTRNSGRAYHPENVPAWANGNRYAILLGIPADREMLLGLPRACWHSSRARAIAGEEGAGAVYKLWDEAWERGERRFGRWPIYVCEDWRDHLVHLAAHEFAHALAHDRDRSGQSEVLCEVDRRTRPRRLAH